MAQNIMAQNTMTSNIQNTVTLVSFDGDIGSGKSTMMKKAEEYYKNNANIIFAEEPVRKWSLIKDKNGTEMLKLFYQDQEKHAFKFQIMAFVSRLTGLREIVKANQGKNIIIITERSLYTDKEIFAKMLFDQGKMSDVEHQIYLTLFDEFAAEFEVNKVVYIRTDPIKCYERIHLRAREGEELIPLAYLEECHRYHETFLDQDRCLFKEQLVLDGNQDIYQNTTLASDWMRQIDDFIRRST
jgi:deoxyadenosine/deoxycytidine kinase